MTNMYNGKPVLTQDTFEYSSVQIGDYVAQEVVDDAMDCLPPACMTGECAQMGEPYSFREDPDTGKWRNTYATFKRVTDGPDAIWQYCGHCFQGENVERGKNRITRRSTMDSREISLWLDDWEPTAITPKSIEVQGARRLLPEDITFGDSIEEMDGVLNFYLECWFSVDQVFGTHVEIDDNDDYLNVYANYDTAAGEVRDELEITLCRGDGANVQLVYKLDGNERTALLDKMRDYCQQKTGRSLEEFAASLQMDDPAEFQTGATPQ